MILVLSEQPWTLLLGGLFLAALLFFVWTQLYRPVLLYAIAVVLLITGALISVERLWVTDRESIVLTLYQIARDIKQDNLPKLLAYIAPEATGIRRLAEFEYHRYQVREVRITKVWEVDVKNDHSPPEGVAKISVIVRGGFRGDEVDDTAMRYVVVHLRRYDKHWKIFAYEHYPPFEAFRREPGSAQPTFLDMPIHDK